jgi:hypothetical protein
MPGSFLGLGLYYYYVQWLLPYPPLCFILLLIIIVWVHSTYIEGVEEKENERRSDE